jgi:hypothetical protein
MADYQYRPYGETAVPREKWAEIVNSFPEQDRQRMFPTPAGGFIYTPLFRSIAFSEDAGPDEIAACHKRVWRTRSGPGSSTSRCRRSRQRTARIERR